MKYKFLDDLTSDVLFEAYGSNLKEVFENAAYAMFTVICDIDTISTENHNEIEVKGKNSEDLLYNFLQELIALVDIEESFFSKFEITSISETNLKATISGEPMSKEKGQTVVKAVTNYKFFLKKENEKYTASVSLDI